MDAGKFFTVFGFGSALVFVWMLVLGQVRTDFLSGAGAFIFFLLVGFGGWIAGFMEKKQRS